MPGTPTTHPSHLKWTDEARARQTDSLVKSIRQAEAIARRVFGVPDAAPITVEYSVDPEIPEWAKFVLQVPVARSAQNEAVEAMLSFYSEALPQVGSEAIGKISIDLVFGP